MSFVNSEDIQIEIDREEEGTEYLQSKLTFFDRPDGGAGKIDSKDEEPILRQNIFRVTPGAPSTQSTTIGNSRCQQHTVHRSQTFDSSFISPYSPSRTNTSSRVASPNRSPTFPFRPNASLRSFQSQIKMSPSFDSSPVDRVILSHSSFDSEDIKVGDKTNEHFPVSPTPLTSGNWWLDETAELTRQLKPSTNERALDIRCEYIEHIVLPTDTLQGLCLAYKVSAMRLRKENGFSGNTLQMAPKKLRIPINTNFGTTISTPQNSPSKASSCESTELLQAPTVETTSESPTVQSLKNESLLKQFNDDKSQHSKDDILMLQDIMHKVREEMKHADNLEEEKRVELEQLLERLESAISRDDVLSSSLTNVLVPTDSVDNHDSNVKNEVAADMSNLPASTGSTYDTYESLRKPLVAVAGGTLVTTGAILVPVPIIPGALVIYAGLSVLATEFEVAGQALDRMKEPLEKILAHEEEVAALTEKEMHKDITPWTDLLPNSQNLPLNINDIDEEFISLMRVTADPCIDEFRKTKNEMKRWMRNILNLECGESATDPNNTENSQAPESKPSPLVRFDSLLSSYGEEVDEDGVASDRLNKISDDMNSSIADLRTLSSLMYNSFSSSNASIGMNK